MTRTIASMRDCGSVGGNNRGVTDDVDDETWLSMMRLGTSDEDGAVSWWEVLALPC